MTMNTSNNVSNGTKATAPLATKPEQNPYLSSGNFAPVGGETTAIDLRVRGSIPPELEGRRLCIGPSTIGPRDPALYHWFTGTGLVHGLRLRGARAEWFRSRFTLSTDAVEALGNPAISGPGNPDFAVNTSVAVVSGRVHAVVDAGGKRLRGRRRSGGGRRDSTPTQLRPVPELGRTRAPRS